MELAEMCKVVRQFMKLSQRKFAAIIGTNQTEISFIERGFIPSDPAKAETIERIYKEIMK